MSNNQKAREARVVMCMRQSADFHIVAKYHNFGYLDFELNPDLDEYEDDEHEKEKVKEGEEVLYCTQMSFDGCGFERLPHPLRLPSEKATLLLSFYNKLVKEIKELENDKGSPLTRHELEHLNVDWQKPDEEKLFEVMNWIAENLRECWMKHELIYLLTGKPERKLHYERDEQDGIDQ